MIIFNTALLISLDLNHSQTSFIMHNRIIGLCLLFVLGFAHLQEASAQKKASFTVLEGSMAMT